MKETRIDLWDKVPLYTEGEIPYMTHYAPDVKRGDGAIVIFPGGGYSRRAGHEGVGYAEFLCEFGVNCFVVEYRVAPNRFPAPLLDARRAIRYVRANAEKFGINPDKIAVMGSSAGGHLAAIAATYKDKIDGEGVDELDNVSHKVNAQILCYPVLTVGGHCGSFHNLLDKNFSALRDSVTPAIICDRETAPLFLWHTAEDTVVNVIGSYEYATRLRELHIPVEMHVYPMGRHGLGLLPEVPYVTDWAKNLEKWLGYMKFIG